MSPTLDAALRSWPFEPWLLAALLLTAGVYVRGWRILRRRGQRRWHAGQLTAFLGGLLAIGLALASPIEPFADLLLAVHMVQHVLLMMAAPPLLWLGEPLFPLLRGLPKPVRTIWAAPLLSSPTLRRLFRRLTHPWTALPLFVATTWFWHLPAVYDLVLRFPVWHYVQHGGFLSAALLFWYPVIRPYPSRPLWSRWLLLPYLLAADLSNTILSAVLTFSDRVLYPHYSAVPSLAGISPLDDQQAAGVLMWVPGSLAFLAPLATIGVRLLAGEGPVVRPSKPKPLASRQVELPLLDPSPHHHRPLRDSRFDLLRVPVLGRFLKWRHARLCLQIPLLIVTTLVIVDGLTGPQVGAMNLAGVLPWIHWRGVLILGLLAAGNVFCMGCPFLLPRTIARRWLPARWTWPRRLRSKWIAVLLVGVFLWAYEAFSLWDRPAWSAWIALGYFAGAFVIDGLFAGASFCKYLCPIGQFNYVQSLASPFEIQVREPAACDACGTKDCIQGRDGIPGCELHLFLPRKASNMDCTTCLDCVHACPHDNVGLIAGLPSAELWHDRQRSSIGRFGRRPDIAALIIVLVFGAFANAAGMVAPVVEMEDRLATLVGVRSHPLSATAFHVFALVILPIVTVGGSARLGRWWGRLPMSTVEVATRFAYALVPIGFAMWLAHYSFHFLTSWDSAIPATQRFLHDLGWTSVGEPDWAADCCRPVAAWLPRLEIVLLDLGLLFSLYSAYRIAKSQRTQRTLGALVPWAILIGLLFALGVWLVFQPMQMRGTAGA